MFKTLAFDGTAAEAAESFSGVLDGEGVAAAVDAVFNIEVDQVEPYLADARPRPSHGVHAVGSRRIIARVIRRPDDFAISGNRSVAAPL